MDFAPGFGGFIPFPALARAHGAPPVAGVLRREPADFRVDEELGFEPEGSGPHHWLLVRKTGCTTPHAARLLAARYALPVREVGFAGLKDRHAETTQWFTVPARAPGHDPGSGEIAAGVRIVRAVRGRRKLRRGVHAGNRFAITIRDVEGDRKAFADRVARVARAGVPSYFGAQRFGRDAGNVAAAAGMLRGDARPPGRLVRGLYLSAGRSLLFNQVLHRRVGAGIWNTYVPGDAVVIAGRRRALAPGASPREGGLAEEWVAALRAHPTGPLWGRGARGGGRSAGPRLRGGGARRLRRMAGRTGGGRPRGGSARASSGAVEPRMERVGGGRRPGGALLALTRRLRDGRPARAGRGPGRRVKRAPPGAPASRPAAQRGGADRGPAALRSEQYVDRPGAPGVVGGGAEREDAVATAKPPVHDRLQHRPPSAPAAPSRSSVPCVDDTHAAKAAPPASDR